MEHSFDIIIIGTGAGGGTLAYALRASGARILVIERGGYLPQEPENWQPAAVFDQARYKNAEVWHDARGGTFHPGVHYYVGGNTKVYGAALPRLRREDFAALEHEGGTAPAWPISYEELEPYYAEAEQIYRVHGEVGADPTDPPRSGPFPFPAIGHEPYIQQLTDDLRRQGLRPYPIPMGIDLREGGSCVRCKTCDGFPCKLHAKSDAEVCAMRPATESPDITLWTHSYARRLLTTPDGAQISGVEVERDGRIETVSAATVVVACGAANSAALLLRSANGAHPEGLANQSGMVGRNYMVHNNTALMAIDPLRRNRTVFQKSMAVNDFYFGGPDFPYPMGNLQLLGKLQAGMLTAAQPLVPRVALQAIADHSVDWWVMSEDLPDPHNQVSLTPSGEICVRWQPNNLAAHRRLVSAASQMLREAGYKLVQTRAMGIETNSHQCGTLRFGDDPATAVLDRNCRAHQIRNLYVVDSSCFPSSAAVNPALTIAANALRIARHLAAP